MGLLHQLFDLLVILTDEEYTRKPVGVVESSIGGHVRHNLDHIQALLRGLPMRRVCYDHRDRGTNVEADRTAALDAILRVERELRDFSWPLVPGAIQLSALVAQDAPPVLVPTTAERELAFVISHTIHHNALIRVMVKLLGIGVPAGDFGYAPSTISHLEVPKRVHANCSSTAIRRCPNRIQSG
ncbi:MAG: DinB family protein [Gemmataceae bacterium]